MLFIFELLLAIIIVAIRKNRKNRSIYQVKIKRFLLKVLAFVLAVMLTLTVLLQELLQHLLNKISKQEKILKDLDVR